MRHLVLIAFMASCNGGGDTYTLYRNSDLDQSIRVHLATFDAKESGAYNQQNCNMIMDIYNDKFQGNPKAWCELGTYKK